jgi:hypothetical protein
MSSRLSVLTFALALPLWAQVPIQIETHMATVNDPGLTGQNVPVTGLFLEPCNVSNKNVIGYSVGARFVDPSTAANAKGLGRHERMATRQTNPLRPGDCDCKNSKPIVIPKTALGVLAEPNVTLDLVVFDDGTIWGPGQLRSSEELRQKLGVNPAQ